MENKKFRWWILLIPVLLAAIVLTVVFWDAIVIRIAPKAVLSSALTKVFAQFEERFQGDPLLILLKSIDAEGKYTADAELSTTNDLVGTVVYDVNIQIDGTAKQVLAEGTATASDTQLDFSWYMDPDFMAVSSDELVNGQYYGITYDTFSEDIRSIPLLSFFISDKLLAQWDESIKNIQTQVSDSYSVPQIPEMSEADLQKILIGILALPCDIENTTVSVGDAFLNCYAISYQLSGEQIDQLLTGTPYAENAVITFTFYLYEKSLIKVDFICISGERSLSLDLLLGQNPLEEPLQLQGIENNCGIFEDFVLKVDTQHMDDHYIESLCFLKTTDWTALDPETGITEAFEAKFDYQLSSGSMKVTSNDTEDPVTLNLTETEKGFCVQTENIVALIQILEQNSRERQDSPIACEMTVSRGSSIGKPVYKNLDQWSLEDFWTLLSSIGSMFGIHIGM